MPCFRLLVFSMFACVTFNGAVADDTSKPKSASPKFELRNGDRVVFLGNTLIERAQKYGYWETMLTARYPDRDITFRNLGWSGDTVWAESRGIFDPPAVGYKRMIEHVGRLKPTVIFVGYGNNEAFAGKEGLPAFIKQYNKLLDDLTAVSADGVRFIILSPLRHEERASWQNFALAHNRRVAEFSIALEALAAKRGILFIDLYSTVIHARADRAILLDLTTNGINLNDLGNLATADTTIDQLHFGGLPAELTKSEPTISISASGKITISRNVTIDKIQPNPNGLRFSVTREYLPRKCGVGEVSGLQVSDLPQGRYQLKIDNNAVHWEAGRWGRDRSDATLAIATHKQWGKGGKSMPILDDGPDYDQIEKLRQTIIEKNRLYFYRWRPQNITYLFGFRKHEQGQNAKELAQFDKLIAAKEAEINKLKKPVPHTYEIIRVKDKPAQKQNGKQSQKK